MNEQEIRERLRRLNRYRESHVKIPLTATIDPTDIEWLLDELEHQLKRNKALAMRKLLERVKLIFEAGAMSGATAANLYDDIKTLLKEKDADG